MTADPIPDRPPRVVLVHLGRPGGMGTWKRIAGLRAIFEGAGAEVAEIRLMTEHRARPADLLRPGLADLARGRSVPEAAAWSRRTVLAQLHAWHPDVVVCCTSRAYHPDLASGPWTVVLDFIDRLSVSYGDRASIREIGPKRFLFRALAGPHARFERAPRRPGTTAIAAGWSDARDLGATWIPITIAVPSRSAADEARDRASTDLVFFGNLSYPPNVEAVARLDRLWPDVVRARPGTSLVVAGARPVPFVAEAAARHGWTLHADFDDVFDLLGSARLGVVPLEHASGIQIKVLETAAFGLPQVVSPAGRAGLGPGFPVEVAATDEDLVRALTELLDDEDRRARLGTDARRHIADRYTSTAYESWAAELLAGRISEPVSGPRGAAPSGPSDR